jgi:hypothetical protein
MQERVSNGQARDWIDYWPEDNDKQPLEAKYARDLLDARKERDGALPVLDAAREHERGRRGEYVMSEAGELRFVAHGIHCEICKAVREYDAARAAEEDGEK